MILLTTSWKLIFARQGEAQDQNAEGSREAGADSVCTNAATEAREPRQSDQDAMAERREQRR